MDERLKMLLARCSTRGWLSFPLRVPNDRNQVPMITILHWCFTYCPRQDRSHQLKKHIHVSSKLKSVNGNFVTATLRQVKYSIKNWCGKIENRILFIDCNLLRWTSLLIQV